MRQPTASGWLFLLCQRAGTPPPRLLQGFVVPLAHGLMRYQTMHAGLELSPRAAVSLRKVA
jgi:hypothetical protein